MGLIRRADLGDAAHRRAIDNYVGRHPQGSVFHRTAWSRAVERGCGQAAHYLVAGSGDGVTGLMPLTEIHSPLFGRALVSVGFAVGGGPIGDDRSTIDALADAGWSLAGRLCCPTLELRGRALPSGPAWQVEQGTYAGFKRPLAADDEAELLAIPRKQRAEVRRALGFDLAVGVGTAAHDRVDHYAVYAESVHNLGTPVFPRALFDAVLDLFGEDADILTVSRGGQPMSSVLSLYHKGVVMPYWGGGTSAARAWRANDLMYHALMRHARARGCAEFDFGRSKLGTGAFAFKKNWGFAPEPLFYALRTANGQAPRETNPMSPRYRLPVALWRKLPLGIANLIGPWIARGLG